MIETCAEAIELSDMGIAHGRCIDDKLIERLINCPLKVDKDKNQRLECGCVASVWILGFTTPVRIFASIAMQNTARLQ